jgi:PAS domain S-box-containing protein
MELGRPGTRKDEGFLTGSGEMASLIRARDWTDTSLGPVQNWPQSLRTTVSICLASNFPINIIWGPDHVQIYNDGYKVVCGEGHPAFLGMPYQKSWESAWPAIGGPFERAVAGETSFLENQRMFLKRNGYLEETFFTFSLSPIRDESGGGIGGLFHPVTETTTTILGERRTRALRDLTARLGEARTTREVLEFAVQTLSNYAFDLPFVAFYQLAEEGTSYRPVTSTGFGDPSAPADMITGAPWILENLAGTGKVEGLRDILIGPCGPYEEGPDAAFVVAIEVPGRAQPQAIVIAGVSPRLPLDETYRGFYDLIGSTLAAALATVQAIEMERRRVEALAAIDNAKTAFFSNVSHEFRTPLTLLLGPLEEMLTDKNRRRDEQVELAHRNALRLQKLVNSLLDFSRVEAGRTQATFAPTELGGFTAELASNFRSATQKAGLDLIVDCPPLSQPAFVDQSMWEKIVLNLLSNAFKFTLEGAIRVSLREVGLSVHLEVADTGAGIPSHELPRVFERFHRIEGQKSRTHEGTGIGLALVDELVRLHGGTISAESEERVGTTFTVALPLGNQHLDVQNLAAHENQSSTALTADAFIAEALRWLPDAPTQAPTNGAASQAKGKVLLADDNSDMRSYVSRILRERGYDVTTVADGAAAIEAARASRPDLVLTDVMMPDVDGFRLLATLRSDQRTADLPVILLSARAGEEARIEGLAAGADDYIVKPFSASELLARVASAIRLEGQRSMSVRQERAALRLSEARLEVALKAGRLGAWELDIATGVATRSPVHDELFGYTPPRPSWTYADFLEHVIHEDRPDVEESFRTALAERGAWHFECRIRRADGEIRWLEALGGPAPETDGAVEIMLGVVSDVTERKAHEERQKILLDELNHRVKNTLASIQAMAMQTQKTAASPAAFARALEGRVLALSRAHDLLAESAWEGASLREVVQRTLEQQVPDPERYSVSGPRIRLGPNASVSFSMAFHELATNALKYGALSNESGKIAVSWTADLGTVVIIWKESAGPMVSAPSQRGFGSRLIERGLARELGGAIVLAFDVDGLCCKMEIPVSHKLEIVA